MTTREEIAEIVKHYVTFSPCAEKLLSDIADALLARLRPAWDAIHDAPHTPECGYPQTDVCDCWKRAALARRGVQVEKK